VAGSVGGTVLKTRPLLDILRCNPKTSSRRVKYSLEIDVPQPLKLVLSSMFYDETPKTSSRKSKKLEITVPHPLKLVLSSMFAGGKD